MATLIQPEQDLQPTPNRPPSDDRLTLREERAPATRAARGPLQRVAGALAAPVLFAVALLGLAVVMADLTVHRLLSLCKGRPQPRGLWES